MDQKADVLIIVDMLNDFIQPDGKLYCGPAAGNLVTGIRNLLSEYRAARKPVIFLCDSHSKNDKEFLMFPEHCVRGTEGAKIVPALTPRDSNDEYIVRKTRYSGFYNTPLSRLLERLRPGVVEICGVCTSICVMDTVGGLANRDYRIKLNPKRVADFSPTNHKRAIERMETLYGVRIYGD